MAPVTNLRGAPVDVDLRQVGRVLAVVGFVAVLALAVVLLVAGVDRNGRIDDLRSHGVPVELTVTTCEGLLGGSGSNAAGYACHGTYAIDGHRYDEAVPGDGFRAPGSTVRVLAVPGDPGLLATPGQLAHEHSSAGVFIAPAVLLLGCAGAVVVVLRRRRGAPTAVHGRPSGAVTS